jgi:FMN phosphatase YigB (HAD superfamily)
MAEVRQMKVSAKRNIGFLLRAARGLLEGSPDKPAEPSQELEVQGLGAAIPSTAAIVSSLVCEGHELLSLQTDLIKAAPSLRAHIRRRASVSSDDASKTVSRKGQVQHVYFDFDQTLSTVHVFKQVAGWERGVPEPHASNERGQIHRISELNRSGKYCYNQPNSQIETDPEGTSWTCAALGGPDRMKQLREFFSELRAADVKMTIITKGNVGAVRCLLANEKLLDFFVTVFGMVGDSYGLTPYDDEHTEVSEYEGTAENDMRSSKAMLITTLMAKEGLSPEEAVLVEDDFNECKSVQGICRYVFVKERRGIGTAEIQSLREIAGLV